MDSENLRADLVRDEGYRERPYVDTVGKITIGVGWNLSDNGLPQDIIEQLLDRSILDARYDLDRNIPWWKFMPEPAQRALVNMAVNLGWPRLQTFKKMLAALEAHDYQTAATEALDSKWHRQVGDRAKRIAALYTEAG